LSTYVEHEAAREVHLVERVFDFDEHAIVCAEPIPMGHRTGTRWKPSRLIKRATSSTLASGATRAGAGVMTSRTRSFVM
jgi:hypothetical protein